MKTTAKHVEAPQIVQTNANKQATVNNILQTYRGKTDQSTIQRVIKVNNEEKSVNDILSFFFKQKLIIDIKEANAVEKVLEVYSDENKSFNDYDSILKEAREEVGNDDGVIQKEEGFSDSERKKISTALKGTYGKQLDVQAKMVAITNWIKGELIDEETQEYFSQVLINGLCGGWVKLFLKYPDWVEPVYNAVRSWKKPINLEGGAALLDFENHLRRTTKFEKNDYVVNLLSEVFYAMRDLEPEAGYINPPAWTRLPEEISPTTSVTQNLEIEEITYKLRNKKASDLICKDIRQRTDKGTKGECMVHIETDLHHMALRVQKTPVRGKEKKTKLSLTVVETEKTGITKTDSWDQVKKVLDLWLVEEPDLKDIILRIFMVGFDDYIESPRHTKKRNNISNHRNRDKRK